MISTLRTGECIIRQAQAGYPHALLAIVDPLPSFRGTAGQVNTHPFTPAESLKQIAGLEEAIKQRKSAFWHARRRQKQAAQISKDAHALLMLLVLHPAVPVVQLFKQMGKKLSPGKQAALREELEKVKYAEFEEDRIGKLNLLIAEALEAGAQQLGRAYAPLPGRGGLPHRTYAAWLIMLAERKGMQARRELVASGTTHPVDVAYEDGAGQWRAFEIVSKSDIIADHLRACLLESHMISRVTIVIPRLNMKEDLQAAIDADAQLVPVRDRIDFLPLINVYEELWPTTE